MPHFGVMSTLISEVANNEQKHSVDVDVVQLAPQLTRYNVGVMSFLPLLGAITTPILANVNSISDKIIT